MTTDVTDSPELTERQERILSLIVREYTNKPEPVGSKYLAETYFTNLSSATIRNDMARLEELGLLAAPHTSAGRIPTEAGYRYFVKRLLAQTDHQLSPEEKVSIAQELDSASDSLENCLRVAVVVLARTAQSAALVTPPRAVARQKSRYKHLALIATQGRLVMMVLVLQGGDVRQQMLTLAEVVPQDTLSAIANRLNAQCEELTSDHIRSHTFDNPLEREIVEIIADTLDEADRVPYIYRDGLTQMLQEFTESEGVQQVLRLVEERSALDALMTDTLDQEVGRVKVVIAGDGRWQEVRHLGIVLSRYGVRGHVIGTMAVLGPMRMRYERAISAVGYVAGLMSDRMLNVYGYDTARNSLPSRTP